MKLDRESIAELKPLNKPYEVSDDEVRGFKVRIQPSGVKTFYFDYRIGGLRRRYRIARVGDLTPAQARQRARELKARVPYGKDPQADKERAKKATLFRYLEDRYWPKYLQGKKSGADSYKRLQTQFKQWRNKHMGTIGKLDVADWAKKRLESGIRPATVLKDYMLLRGMMASAAHDGVIDANPLHTVKTKHIVVVDRNVTPRYLDCSERARLIETLRSRDMRSDMVAAIVSLALNTGLRRGELFNLEWQNVNLSPPKPSLTVEGGGAKSGQSRRVPLNPTALDTLKQWRGGRGIGLVFPSPRTGKRLVDIKKGWAELRDEAGLKSFRFHDLRHDFATQSMARGTPAPVVQQLLGHADITTTMRYAHVLDEALEAAVRVDQ